MSATISYGDLTNYGMGKFTKELDELVYALGNGGFCDTVGNVDECDYHYTFVDVDFEELPSHVSDIVAKLDEDDLAFLRDQYGAVVREDNLGFVGVDYYATKREFLKACAEAEEEVNAIYAEQEQEEEEEEEEHVHVWGPVETSRFTGTPHRRCVECGMVSLDLDEEEDDDGE